MKINDILYFAPGIRFSEVDLNGSKLPDQFKHRVDWFYVEPAKKYAESRFPFAAGLLLVSCIDALAHLRFRKGVRDRFVKFAREELRSFSRDGIAVDFYEDFRNGLVHEGRLKNGGQFSPDIGKTVQQSDGILLVNPKHLAEEVSSALDSYVDLLRRDEAERQKLATTLRKELYEDFGVASDGIG
jgi:hypothetical protein